MRPELRTAFRGWRQVQRFDHCGREGLFFFRHDIRTAAFREDRAGAELGDGDDRCALRHGFEQHQPLRFRARGEHERITGRITIRQVPGAVEVTDESHRLVNAELTRETLEMRPRLGAGARLAIRSTAITSETSDSIAATTSRQNVRPTTAAEKSTVRKEGGSTSSRAAIAAVTVTGRPEPEAPSAMAAVSSSTNSGFPSDRTAICWAKPGLPRKVQASMSTRWHPTMSMPCPAQPSTVQLRTRRSSISGREARAMSSRTAVSGARPS